MCLFRELYSDVLQHYAAEYQRRAAFYIAHVTVQEPLVKYHGQYHKGKAEPRRDEIERAYRAETDFNEQQRRASRYYDRCQQQLCFPHRHYNRASR